MDDMLFSQYMLYICSAFLHVHMIQANDLTFTLVAMN